MEFTRTAQVVAGILFHSSIMTSRSCWMLDTWCFYTFHFRISHMCSIGFRSRDILGHSINFSSKAVFILVVFEVVIFGSSFWREGIIFCFRMSQYMLKSMFPSMNHSSPVWAVVMQPPDHDATTTMLDCSIAHQMLDTIWVKQVYLRLFRPRDMVPVIHALGQVVYRLFLWASFRRRFLLRRRSMQTDLLQYVVYGLSSDKLTFHFCNL